MHDQDQTAGEKKPPLRGGSFVSLSLRLELGMSHGHHWRRSMLWILPRPCNVFSFRGWRHWGAWSALFDARGSIHCAENRHSPKRSAPGQNLNAWRKKTAFAGRFFRKPQLATEAWCISWTTLACIHLMNLRPSLQRLLPSEDRANGRFEAIGGLVPSEAQSA
jgi:hypothetical protein